jgi:AcrR family transcriptional regulator
LSTDVFEPSSMTEMQPEAESGGEVTAAVPSKSARERLLEVATDLFYREGIRAVGIDTIIARSGVAKMSLYRNFLSKDDLVVAFLEHRDGIYWAWWDHVMAKNPDDPSMQIDDLFASLARRVTAKSYRGCPFINTATEFPDPDHPARALCLANKRKLRDRLRGLATRAGARDAEALADQLLLLMEGAYASAQTFRTESPALRLQAAAKALVAAQCPDGGPPRQ